MGEGGFATRTAGFSQRLFGLMKRFPSSEVLEGWKGWLKSPSLPSPIRSLHDFRGWKSFYSVAEASRGRSHDEVFGKDIRLSTSTTHTLTPCALGSRPIPSCCTHEAAIFQQLAHLAELHGVIYDYWRKRTLGERFRTCRILWDSMQGTWSSHKTPP